MYIFAFPLLAFQISGRAAMRLRLVNHPDDILADNTTLKAIGVVLHQRGDVQLWVGWDVIRRVGRGELIAIIGSSIIYNEVSIQQGGEFSETAGVCVDIIDLHKPVGSRGHHGEGGDEWVFTIDVDGERNGAAWHCWSVCRLEAFHTLCTGTKVLEDLKKRTVVPRLSYGLHFLGCIPTNGEN